MKTTPLLRENNPAPWGQLYTHTPKPWIYYAAFGNPLGRFLGHAMIDRYRLSFAVSASLIGSMGWGDWRAARDRERDPSRSAARPAAARLYPIALLVLLDVYYKPSARFFVSVDSFLHFSIDLNFWSLMMACSMTAFGIGTLCRGYLGILYLVSDSVAPDSLCAERAAT